MSQFTNPSFIHLRLPCIMLCILLFQNSLLTAQVQDDFTDGDFTMNPAWSGKLSSFIINSSRQLQLKDDIASTSFLSTENRMIAETEWQFWVKSAFNPSQNNFVRVYLVANKQDLSQSLDGYYIQLGESGSADAIALYRQSGDEHQLVCRGTDGLVASSFAIRIKVVRKGGGSWKIYADPSGGTNFLPEAEGFDASHTGTAWFGILCTYTISNSTKIYFDDFYAGPVQYDTSPPEIEQLQVISQLELDVNYTEAVKKEIAENVHNYALQPGNKHPQLAGLDSDDPSLLHLYFEEAFTNGSSYILHIKDMQDYSGNIAASLSDSFTYFNPQAYDICINEIMADPSPVMGLPEYEYLELANNTGFDINLNAWQIRIGNSIKSFSQVILPADGYLILAKQEAAAELSGYGSFYGFESFSLTNSGQEISIQNPYGQIIAHIDYEDAWYKDKDKDEGGWSLEQIDQHNPCCGKNNWKASESQTGGTPGETNSVDANKSESPWITSIGFIDSKTIVLYFNQKMDSVSILNPEAYEISKGIGSCFGARAYSPGYNEVILTFKENMQYGIMYDVLLKDTLYNCRGIPLHQENILQTGIPAEAAQSDVVINEVLFNPKEEGVDYVEIYNRSKKIVELNKLKLTSVMQNYPNPPDTGSTIISMHTVLMFPSTYLLLSPSSEAVMNQYFTEDPAAFMDAVNFPRLNNDEGMILLQNVDGSIIDKMHYSEKMQYPLLNYYDGVALERINYNRISSDESNWQSASGNVGYGTPGYENSQFVPELEIVDPIRIEPEVFSPDGDGKNDVLNIHYKFNQAGNNVTIRIFNAAGKIIKNLVSNALTGSQGSFSWNGLDENKQPAAPGIYVIYFEVFDPSGKVEKYKKTGVLGMKF